MKRVVARRDRSGSRLVSVGIACAIGIIPPKPANADTWIADPLTPSPFGADANWSLGTVPVDPESAIIDNGGTATIADGDIFNPSRIVVGQATTGNAIIQSGGQVALIGPLQVGNGTGASGSYSVGGTSEILTGGTGSSDNTAIGRSGGTGEMTISDGAAVTVSSGEFFVGQGAGSNGTLTMSGATSELVGTNWIAIGRQGGVGNVVLNGSARFHTAGGGFVVGAAVGNSSSQGTLTINENAQAYYEGGNAVFIGEGATGTVTVNGSGNFRSDNSGIWVGQGGGGTGTLNLNDSATSSANNETYIGNDGGTGFFTMSGSSTFSTPSQKLVISRTNGTGTVVVEDNAVMTIGGGEIVVAENATGSLTIRGNAQVIAANGINVYVGSAPFSNGSMTPGNGTLTMEGGTLNAQTGQVVVALQATGTGHVQMNGGVIRATTVRKGAGAGTISFNGGGVQATAASTDYFNGFTAANIDIQAGGMRFDTAGNTVTITQQLAGAGGIVKLGDGILTLDGGGAYTGDTVIEDGTLTINTGFLADGSNVWMTTGGVFNLDFTGTDTINALFVDGEAMELGTYGATGSGAQHIDDTLFAGLGTLTVTSLVPEPSVLALLLMSGVFAGCRLRRRS